MNRLSFLLARTMRREARLLSLSCGRESLMTELEGRAVALVGNARSLAETAQGAAIDAADLVIRINRAPMPSATSHGTRSDWLALATSIAGTDLERIGATRVLWMSPKRKRLPYAIAISAGFYLHPRPEVRCLRDQFGAPPTTGLMMIDLLAASRLKSLTLFGFDFFQSLSLTGSRTAQQVPHDFAAEHAYVEALIARDARISLWVS